MIKNSLWNACSGENLSRPLFYHWFAIIMVFNFFMIWAFNNIALTRLTTSQPGSEFAYLSVPNPLLLIAILFTLFVVALICYALTEKCKNHRIFMFSGLFIITIVHATALSLALKLYLGTDIMTILIVVGACALALLAEKLWLGISSKLQHRHYVCIASFCVVSFFGTLAYTTIGFSIFECIASAILICMIAYYIYDLDKVRYNDTNIINGIFVMHIGHYLAFFTILGTRNKHTIDMSQSNHYTDN